MSKDLDWKFEEELTTDEVINQDKTESPSTDGSSDRRVKTITPKTAKIAIIVLSIISAIAICTSVAFAASYMHCYSEVNELQKTVDAQKSIIASDQSGYNSLNNRYNGLRIELNELKQKYDFYYEYAACVDKTYTVSEEDAYWYHHPDCSFFDDSSFWIYNKDAAEEKGYRPCPMCWK